MYDKIVEKLNKELTKNLIYLFFISCFWAVSFYIFKPQILKEDYHIQFFLLFSFSFIWMSIYLIFWLFFEIAFRFGINKVRIEVSVFTAIVFKSVFITIGYYYSMYFTQYLQMCFKWSTYFIIFLLPISVFLHIRRSKKKLKSQV